MYGYLEPILSTAEKRAASGASLETILATLRMLPLDCFGELFIDMPNEKYAALSNILPRMASAQVQRDWTGTDGRDLLRQTITFTRLLRQAYLEHCKTPLKDASILDFGCGYGRMLRAMYYFSTPSNLYGCDPWDHAISLCREANIFANLALSDYLPTRLPFDQKFDLIYAFSVFTHLSERATRQCLNVLADALQHDGLLVITIRPVEYWRRAYPAVQATEMCIEHVSSGFAFMPHNLKSIDGDVTYGDTSMGIDYLERQFPTLRIVKIEHTLDDPNQIILCMKRRDID